MERDRLERRERNSSEARVRETKFQTSSLTSLLDEDDTKNQMCENEKQKRISDKEK